MPIGEGSTIVDWFDAAVTEYKKAEAELKKLNPEARIAPMALQIHPILAVILIRHCPDVKERMTPGSGMILPFLGEHIGQWDGTMDIYAGS